MIRSVAHLFVSLVVALVFSQGLDAQERGPSGKVELKIMSFNVWSGENSAAGRAKLVEIIQAANPDIVGLQEMGNSSGQIVAQMLGYFYHQQSGSDIQVLSRYAVVGTSPQNYGTLIAIGPGVNIWLFNCHLPAYPYQPYDLRDGILPPNETAVINAAESARGTEIDVLLNDMSTALSSATPVFFVGDFNEPSHLDWTQLAADSTKRPFDLKVEYPASRKVIDHGMSDSYRAVRPDEVNDRGYTWTPGYPPPNLDENEVHDRIDIVYYKGSGVVPLTSETVGFSLSNPNTDIAIPGYNADHRAVVSSFAIAVPDQSVLTFEGLQHNPGNDGALNDGGYGDHWVATPDIELEFSATGTSTWDTYDGDQDNNGNNNWNGGVGQLQYGTGSAEYDVAFVPMDGAGVVVDSFELVDYVNFSAGHTVNWELWLGQPNNGSLLAQGQEVVAEDMIVSVSTGYVDAEFGLLTLRFEHLAGNGTDLAVDNIQFRQVSKSACLLGDVNLDGQINLLDVANFVSLLANGQFQCEGDLNDDGSVNLLDVEPFIDLLSGN